MQVGVLDERAAMSDYVLELLHGWGVRCCRRVSRDEMPAMLPDAMPVVVVPACDTADIDAVLIDYASSGGTVIAIQPKGGLAAACGLSEAGTLDPPMRLRPWGFASPGLAGEQLPIVGSIARYDVTQPDVEILGYLCHASVSYDEYPAIVRQAIGGGALVGLAFDLPRAVMLARQGDPARAEFIPPGDGCARTMHMAVDIGGIDAGLFPFADLLARMLVELVMRAVAAPLPRLDHLPAGASAIVLYSGDEDVAPLDSIQQEFADVRQRDARMNLYIIPEDTHSTRTHVDAYCAHHDIGPHPNLRGLDRKPIAERVAEYDRQLSVFADHFGVPPRSVRNHCHAWAGYLDLVDIQAKHGIRMDANYPSVTYMRSREDGPYTTFGAAMPMRFVRPDGGLIDVYQQHTHISDDSQFYMPADVRETHYSFRTSIDAWRVHFARYLGDAMTRFHMPLGCNFHPSNWVKFSRDFGVYVLDAARERGVPVWSYDQWAAWWDARDAWTISDLSWDGAVLLWSADGPCVPGGFVWEVPVEYAGRSLASVTVDGTPCEPTNALRHGRRVAQLAVAGSATQARIEARYE